MDFVTYQELFLGMRKERYNNVFSALEEMAQHVGDTSHLITSLTWQAPNLYEARVSYQTLQSTCHFLVTQVVIGTDKILSRMFTGHKSIWPIMLEMAISKALEDKMHILVTVF